MTRLLTLSSLLILACLLSGCGIKGGLKTPPPLWGDSAKVEAEAPSDASANVDDPADTFADPLDDGQTEDEDVGYGVDVADQP